MKINPAAWWLGLLVLIVGVSGCSADRQPEISPVCFAATGHTVRGDFLHKFQSVGGTEALGYPITEPFEQEGRLVQYFEYARLEDHPDNPGGAVVKLSMLGEKLSRRNPPLAASRVPPSMDRNSRYYPQSGHAVRGDFLNFFDEKGGLDLYGFPIAEPLPAHGWLVQDFQRARFVWLPRADGGSHVTLEPIGRIYFETQGLDPDLLAPVACPDGARH